MNIKKKLGARIRELRVIRSWTQEALAERIGIETASLSNIENGKTYPSSDTIEGLIQVFDVSPYELFVFEHIEKPSPQKLISKMVAGLEKDDELVYKMYNVFRTLYKN